MRRGATLIELVLVTTVLSLVALIAVARFSSLRDRIAARGAANDVAATFALARHSALLRAMAAMPGRPVPVLLVGRNLAAEDVRTGLELGVRDCLAKPFSGAVVLERLTRMLKRHATAPTPARPVVHINA